MDVKSQKNDQGHKQANWSARQGLATVGHVNQTLGSTNEGLASTILGISAKQF